MNFSNQLHFDTAINQPLTTDMGMQFPASASETMFVVYARDVQRTGELLIGNILVPLIPMTEEEVLQAEALAELQAEADFNQEEIDRLTDEQLDGMFNRMADDANDFSPDIFGYGEDDEDMLFDGEDLALSRTFDEGFNPLEYDAEGNDIADISDEDRWAAQTRQVERNEAAGMYDEPEERFKTAEAGDYPDFTSEQWKAIEKATEKYQDGTGAVIVSGEPFEPLQRIEGHTLTDLLLNTVQGKISPERLAEIAAMPDDQIDTSDIPEATAADFAEAETKNFNVNSAINARFGAATCLKCNLAAHNCGCEGGSIVGVDAASEDEQQPRCMFCGEDQADCLNAGGHDMNGDKVRR